MMGMGWVLFHFFGTGLLGRYSKVAPEIKDEDSEFLDIDRINANIEKRKKQSKNTENEQNDESSEQSGAFILEELEKKESIRDIRLKKVCFYVKVVLRIWINFN